MKLNLAPKKNNRWLPVAKAIMLAIPIYFLLSLINQHIFLTSALHYAYRPGHASNVVTPKTPAQILRTGDPKLPWRISVDNFLFNVYIPRLIEAVRIRVRLDPGTQPLVTFNAFGKKGNNYSKIVSSKALNQLNWKHVNTGQVTLWMRDASGPQPTEANQTNQAVKQYDSVDSFVAQPPDMASVGVVGLDGLAFTTIDHYSPSTLPLRLGHTLRGSHNIYIYAAHENIHLTFDKIDLNRSKGTDGVTIRVFRVNGLVPATDSLLKTVTVADDGVSGTTGPRGKAQPVSVEIPDVPAGVYRISINTSDDVLLANLTSSQHLLSFAQRVYFADGPAYGEATFKPIILKTTSTRLTFAANHEQGKQEIVVSGKKVSLPEAKVEQVVSKLSGSTTVAIPKGDIIISSDGLLAIDDMQLLPGGAREVDISTATPDLQTFNYILADYVPAADNTLQFDNTFAINNLDLKGNALSFSIDSQNLQTNQATLGLRDVRVTLIRGKFPWDKVWKKLGIQK